MGIHLSVTRQFGNYQRGDIISDPAEMAEVKAGSNAHDVRQVISKPEHLSGDFFRTDLELAERRARAKAAAIAARPVVTAKVEVKA